MSLHWCLALCPPSGTSVPAGPGSPSKDGEGDWEGAVAMGTRSGEERLSLLRVCLPREPGGENGAGNQIEKSECLVEEGKLETGVEAAGKIVGCLGARGGERGWEGAGRMGGGRDGGKQLGKKPSSQEAKLLLLVLSFLDKSFLSI